jgi:hypothetical protein
MAQVRSRWVLALLLLLAAACGKKEPAKPAVARVALKVAPVAPAPVVTEWSASASLEPRVVVEGVGLAFRPPAGWKKGGGTIPEWLSTDASTGANVTFRTGSAGRVPGSIARTPKEFVDSLRKQYQEARVAAYSITGHEVVRAAGREVLAVFGQGRLEDLDYRNLQLFVEAPGRTTVVTFTARAAAFDSIVDAFKASALSLEVL